jgi:hypothetical protein
MSYFKRLWAEMLKTHNALAIDVYNWKSSRNATVAKQGENRMARIEITPEGKAALFDGSTPVATYARKRDAVRGAARRGLQLAA